MAFYNKNALFMNIFTSLMIILLGASILSDGIDITTVTHYAFENLHPPDDIHIGVQTEATNYTSVFISAFGSFLVLLGIAIFWLTFYYLYRGGSKEAD